MYITIVNIYVVVFVRIFNTDGILEEAIIRVRAIIRDNTVFINAYIPLVQSTSAISNEFSFPLKVRVSGCRCRSATGPCGHRNAIEIKIIVQSDSLAPRKNNNMLYEMVYIICT